MGLTGDEENKGKPEEAVGLGDLGLRLKLTSVLQERGRSMRMQRCELELKKKKPRCTLFLPSSLSEHDASVKQRSAR